MVINCAAVGCSNVHNKESNKSFHRLPADSKETSNLRKAWLHNIKLQPPLPKDKNFFICSDHFEKYCFERDFKVRYEFCNKKTIFFRCLFSSRSF